MNLKTIFCGMCAALIMMSCAESVTQYTINGVWPEGNGETVYLKTVNGKVILDSAVVADGRYKMQKPFTGTALRVLEMQKKRSFFILDSVPVQVITKSEVVKRKYGNDIKISNTIKGGLDQDIYATAMGVINEEIANKYALIYRPKGVKLTEDNPDYQKYKASKIRKQVVLDSLLANYPKTCAGVLLVDHYGSNNKSYADLLEYFNSLPACVQTSEIGQSLKKNIESKKIIAEGSVAPDFTLKTIDGKDLSLKDLRGQYVLLDFWASWCGPCRREIPNLKQIYETYHEKGFEILSVSLDDKEEAWKGAIEKEGLNWKHVTSLKGWKCEVAAQYHVSGIPAMFLLDKEGKIIGTGLRGVALQKKVAELFNC